ncbi:hypothetical protein Q5P01_019142 [Channa striata]|uniref:Uncharacterized protein n=1 Tax=Channa striata TaxID=64152 RepID=A0AA88M3E8_CHASR|nr:hypothetical protein Q5P01_019142 [Channa striata]
MEPFTDPAFTQIWIKATVKRKRARVRRSDTDQQAPAHPHNSQFKRWETHQPVWSSSHTSRTCGPHREDTVGQGIEPTTFQLKGSSCNSG